MSDLVMRYYVDAAGNYLGGWDSNPPAGAEEVHAAPADARQLWKDGAWSVLVEDRLAEIDALLIALDLASVRPLRSVLAAAEPAPEDVAKLAELDAQATELRAERALLLPPPTLLEPVQPPEPEAGQPQ